MLYPKHCQRPTRDIAADPEYRRLGNNCVYVLFQTGPERGEFLKKITGLMFKMVEQFCPVDSACDQMGKQFLHDALPPVLTDGRPYIHSAHIVPFRKG